MGVAFAVAAFLARSRKVTLFAALVAAAGAIREVARWRAQADDQEEEAGQER